MTTHKDAAYEAGYRCGFDGPNTNNCHFKFFATPELLREWERGKAVGEVEKLRAGQEVGAV